MLIGAIADDLTGATDLALMLARGGMRVIQVIGPAASGGMLANCDAAVVALKSRTIPAEQAVSMSLAAAKTLLAAGTEQLFFKYCSTFDSTDAGNIGPVAEALLDLVGAEVAIACPAFPANGRSVYQGHLFVGDKLLSDSSMKDHPLTPMRDADLVRVLQRQTRSRVGLVPFAIVNQGAAMIRSEIEKAKAEGCRLLIVDAITDEHLHNIGKACATMPLVTGGSGVAMGLPGNFRETGQLALHSPPSGLTAPVGRSVILAGSCSAATRGQVTSAIAAGTPAFRVEPADVASGATTVEQILAWVLAQSGDRAPLVYSSAEPGEVLKSQEKLGRERAGALIETLLGNLARALAERGFTRFIVAGGETSGAVVAALGVEALQIGPEIDSGVPWTRSVSAPDVALALKSGNFGAPDFFLKAWTLLRDGPSSPGEPAAVNRDDASRHIA